MDNRNDAVDQLHVEKATRSVQQVRCAVMKVLVLWENSSERALAENLVNVLRKIGAMLVYGKVNDSGVLLEDWKSKPKVTLECLATQSPSAEYASPYSSSFYPGEMSYTYEMEYRDGYGYGQPVPVFKRGESAPGTLSITRELTRDLVRMFPDRGSTAKAVEAKKTKPFVPQPKTTKTGVTVRDLDIWEEDEDIWEEDEYDDDDDPFGLDED